MEFFYILLNGTPDKDILRGEWASVQLIFPVLENIIKLLKIHVKKRNFKKCFIEFLGQTLVLQMHLLYFVLSSIFFTLHSLFYLKHGNLPTLAFSDKFCYTKQVFISEAPSSSYFIIFLVLSVFNKCLCIFTSFICMYT